MASGLQELNFVASVTERDIDFLVLEELQVSPEFRDWFAARVFERPIFKSHVAALHSVVDSALGESDLIFIFEASDGSTKAVLIENKISADAQPNQGGRYTARGEKGLADGYWQEYQTCLIAPRRYLESPSQTQSYQCQVAYEEIMAFFAAGRTLTDRHQFRATMMMEAVNQHRRGYQPKTNEAMTEFVVEYWAYATASHAALGMPEPKPRAAGNTWINFFPSGFPKYVEVVHQLTAGYVKVFFKAMAPEFDTITDRYKDLSNTFPDLAVELAGKSVAITVPVDAVKPLEVPFGSVSSKVADVLTLMERLVREVSALGFPR